MTETASLIGAVTVTSPDKASMSQRPGHLNFSATTACKTLSGSVT